MKSLLQNDLDSRINPEKSRNFHTDYYIEHLKILEKIYDKIKSHYFNINPIKISIVGTNGKGSTGYYLSQLFFYNQFSTGFYSSPHLISFTERIQVNLKNFSLQEIDNFYKIFLENFITEEFYNDYKKLSYFELLTIFCVFLFYFLNVKIQIYEAGMGGRLDATRIVSPDYIILTNVKLDHINVLGNTIEKILKEKLGIISENTKKIMVGDIFLKNKIENTLKNNNVVYYSEKYPENYLNYLKNFSKFCFIQILENSYPEINTDIPLKNLPGRLEFHKINNQYYIFDVCHNVSGIYHFLHSLLKKFDDISIHNTMIILGILKDRKYKDFYRVFKFTKLKNHFPLPFIPDIEEFNHSSLFPVINKNELEKIVSNKKYIIICGSFRLYNLYLLLIKNNNVIDN